MPLMVRTPGCFAFESHSTARRRRRRRECDARDDDARDDDDDDGDARATRGARGRDATRARDDDSSDDDSSAIAPRDDVEDARSHRERAGGDDER